MRIIEHKPEKWLREAWANRGHWWCALRPRGVWQRLVDLHRSVRMAFEYAHQPWKRDRRQTLEK